MSVSIAAQYNCDVCNKHTKVWMESDRWCGRNGNDDVVYLEPIKQIPPMPPGWVQHAGQHYCPNHSISIRKVLNIGTVEVDKDG